MSSALSPVHLALAVRRLRAGGVIAYPTEAVWGLGCDPWRPEAVARVWDIKRRDPGKGLILIAADAAQFSPWLDDLSSGERALLDASWPGPVTWLIPVPPHFPAWLRGRHDSVALRVSAHPGVQALCRAFGGALVSTSANHAGRPAARSLFEVRLRLGNDLDGILPGRLGGLARPTEIRDLRTRRVLRSG